MAEANTVTVKSIWNMDDARMKVLNEYLIYAENAIISWNCEEAYLQLQGVELVLWGALDKKEKEEIVKQFKKIEILRRTRNPENERQFRISTSHYKALLANLYKEFNNYMVKHGLYFRKGDDPGKAMEM